MTFGPLAYASQVAQGDATNRAVRRMSPGSAGVTQSARPSPGDDDTSSIVGAVVATELLSDAFSSDDTPTLSDDFSAGGGDFGGGGSDASWSND